jgi:hypothetical protein
MHTITQFVLGLIHVHKYTLAKQRQRRYSIFLGLCLASLNEAKNCTSHFMKEISQIIATKMGQVWPKDHS